MRTRFAILLALFLIALPTALLAQEVDPITLLLQFDWAAPTSMAVLVVATIALTGVQKKMFADTPLLSRIPVFFYVLFNMELLIFAANQLFATLPGSWPQVAFTGFIMSFVAAGAREVVYNKLKPLADAGKTPLILLLALVLGASTLAGCATFNSQLRHAAVVGEAAATVALGKVQDTSDELLAHGTITLEQRQTIGSHLLPALTITRDLVRVTMAWKPGTPTPMELLTLVRELNTLGGDVLTSLPPAARAAIEGGLTDAKNAVRDLFAKVGIGGISPTSSWATVVEVTLG